MGVLGVDRMEEQPLVEMEGNTEAADAKSKCGG